MTFLSKKCFHDEATAVAYFERKSYGKLASGWRKGGPVAAAWTKSGKIHIL
jgi:hypothetical protein